MGAFGIFFEGRFALEPSRRVLVLDKVWHADPAFGAAMLQEVYRCSTSGLEELD